MQHLTTCNIQINFLHLQEAETAEELKKLEELGKAEVASAIASEKASQLEKMAEADLSVCFL